MSERGESSQLDATTINTPEFRPVRTQFLIFTLFGDYVVQRGGTIWTSSLLYLMELLGVSERAVRSTLSRMSRKGWIKARKHGRRSRYHVTNRGQSLLDEGHSRIFEPIYTEWDGYWHLVLYSLPERKRRRRHALRTKLSWLGYGRLAPGTWISPHDRRAELKSVFADLGVEPYVDIFCGDYLGPASAGELVMRCWDLSDLEQQYRDFIARYEPEYLQCLELANGQRALNQQDCFVRRFWLTYDYQAFPLKDPNLPTALLSCDWIGFAARQLFDNYRGFLGDYAEDFINEIVGGDGLPPTSS